MNKIENMLNRVIGLVSVISYVCFFFIMMITILDVALRSLFNKPILGTYELVEQVVFCAVFASFAYGQQQKMNIHITLLTSLFPYRLERICSVFTYLLGAVIVGAIAYAAYVQSNVALSSRYKTWVLGIPTYPFYWVECVTMVVFFLLLILEACKSLMMAVRPRM